MHLPPPNHQPAQLPISGLPLPHAIAGLRGRAADGAVLCGGGHAPRAHQLRHRCGKGRLGRGSFVAYVKSACGRGSNAVRQSACLAAVRRALPTHLRSCHVVPSLAAGSLPLLTHFSLPVACHCLPPSAGRGSEIGDYLTTHPLVSAISFTGEGPRPVHPQHGRAAAAPLAPCGSSTFQYILPAPPG